MKQFIKYFLVIGIWLLGIKVVWAASNAVNSFEVDTRLALTNQYLKCFSTDDQKTYAAAISAAVDKALSSQYCQCGGPNKTGEQMIDIVMANTGSNQASAIEGRAELYAKDALEDQVSELNKELEQLNGATVGTPAGDKFAALKAKRDALRAGVQSYYSHGNLASRSSDIDCKTIKKSLAQDDGLFISDYNASQANQYQDGFNVTDSQGNQTFITPTDVFVANSQNFSDSAATLLKKCLATCKTKGGTSSECTKVCNIPRCGCRDTDNNGVLETVCEPAQFGPECLGVMSCNVRLCDDPQLLNNLGSGAALSALVAKYYKTSPSSPITNQNPITEGNSDIQVSQISVSKTCSTGGCDITLTSTVDNQFQAGYLHWDANAQNASLITSLMITNGRIELIAGKPKTVHLNTAVANELQLSDGTRVECLSCNGDNTLANRLSTGCDKAGETNPHAECKTFYGCGQSEPTYGCYRFDSCGVNQCNDYLPDKDGNKLQSADCKVSDAGQKWKCASHQKCIASSDGTYTTQSECLSSLACGGGGTEVERHTYYCCDKSTGSCSQCTDGSPRYVNPTQCASDCSKIECPKGSFKCGTNCCDSLNETCSNYECVKAWSCSGECCANGCKVKGTVTGVCGGSYGSYPSCCETCN